MIVLFLLSTCGYVYAGTVTINYGSGPAAQSIQNTSGGATSQSVTPTAGNPTAVNPDVFATPPVPLGAPPAGEAVPAPALGIGIGATAIWSPNVQVYAIPASYSLTNDLKLGVNIPYIEKQLTGEYTGEELTARGLGDVSVDVRYRYGNEKFVQGISAFSVKLPTGSYKQFEGRREILSLGTGSYDVMINQTFSKTVGNYQVVANVGYRWNMKSDYTETDNFGLNIKYENRQGNIFNYLVGVSYGTPIPGLTAYCNIAGLFIDRSYSKETNSDTGVVLRDEGKKDRLRTLDVIPGVKLQITQKIGFRLGVVIPTLTGYDPDAINPEKRDWAVDFGMAALF
jgi:hypothetical protein